MIPEFSVGGIPAQSCGSAAPGAMVVVETNRGEAPLPQAASP
jgi:hypothetical protein